MRPWYIKCATGAATRSFRCPPSPAIAARLHVPVDRSWSRWMVSKCFHRGSGRDALTDGRHLLVRVEEYAAPC